MDTYRNLNSVTLYKTPMFNVTDTLLFSSKTARDNYFDSISSEDKLVMEEFTDLYEDRLIALPYNYLDLKKYNTMKMYYNDGLGHEMIYYCNVDNYYYVSTDTCVPIYRIDYFLTFGYLLANRNLDIITDRRTLLDNEVTKLIKSDDVTVPRVKYIPQNIAPTQDRSDNTHYIIYLNKTQNNDGVNGFKINFKLKYLTDEYLIDTYSIGCYVCVCDEVGLADRLATEPMEYIEKVVEAYGDMPSYGAPEIHPEHYYYIEGDFDAPFVWVNNDTPYEASYNKIWKTNRTGDQFNTYKKIMKRLNCLGLVVQGNEFDPKDYENDIKPLGVYYDNIVFTFLGMAVFYPLGYRGIEVNKDYSVTWQTGRNISYSSEYTNSLAYKESVELNNQAIKYANKSAGINSYYINQLLTNSNQQIDISKRQSDASYEAQINSLNQNRLIIGNELLVANAQSANYWTIAKDIIGETFGKGSLTQRFATAQNLTLNDLMLTNNIGDLTTKKLAQDKLYDKQVEANTLNSRLQCDLIALNRDNTIANLNIANKYNNAKPNAYNSTDYTKFTNYVYHIVIDELSENDRTQQHALETYYNVNGIYVGYKEKVNLSTQKGLLYDYIKGSLINNSNMLSEELTIDIYTQLVTRIENGVRIWRNISYFGDMQTDNTNISGTIPPTQNLSESDMTYVLDKLYEVIYGEDLPDKDTVTSMITGNAIFEASETDLKNYALWVNNNLYWGTYPLSAEDESRMTVMRVYIYSEFGVDRTADFYSNIVENMYDLTIYEKQSMINYWRTEEQNEDEEEE